jgi:hypothetical protein
LAWRGVAWRLVFPCGQGSLWYHDHTLGFTANNVYAGIAAMYFQADCATEADKSIMPKRAYHWPLMIQVSSDHGWVSP